MIVYVNIFKDAYAHCSDSKHDFYFSKSYRTRRQALLAVRTPSMEERYIQTIAVEISTDRVNEVIDKGRITEEELTQ